MFITPQSWFGITFLGVARLSLALANTGALCTPSYPELSTIATSLSTLAPLCPLWGSHGWKEVTSCNYHSTTGNLDSLPSQGVSELQYSTAILEPRQSLPFRHCRRRYLVPPWQVWLQSLQLPQSDHVEAEQRDTQSMWQNAFFLTFRAVLCVAVRVLSLLTDTGVSTITVPLPCPPSTTTACSTLTPVSPLSPCYPSFTRHSSTIHYMYFCITVEPW